MIAAYLIDPARRTYELDELAADEGISVAARRGPPSPTTASSRSTAAEEAAGRSRRDGPARLGAGRAAAARSSPTSASSG